jgi:hypothetical protein
MTAELIPDGGRHLPVVEFVKTDTALHTVRLQYSIFYGILSIIFNVIKMKLNIAALICTVPRQSSTAAARPSCTSALENFTPNTCQLRWPFRPRVRPVNKVKPNEVPQK